MVVAEKVGWVEVCHTTIRFFRGVTTADLSWRSPKAEPEGRQYETRTRRQWRLTIACEPLMRIALRESANDVATSLPLIPKRKPPGGWLNLRNMAGPTRLELATSGVTGLRSNQLNYDPALE